MNNTLLMQYFLAFKWSSSFKQKADVPIISTKLYSSVQLISQENILILDTKHN